MAVFINLMGGIISQCICISYHYIVHFKYLVVSSINLGKAEKISGSV